MRQRGFSLVELMVTVSVLGILMLSALPSLRTWLDNTRIRNAADALQDGLQQARAEAVKQNRNMSFWLVAGSDPAVLANDCTLSSTSGSWVVSVNSPLAHCGDDPSNTSSPMIVTKRAVGDAGGRVAVTAVSGSASTASSSLVFNGFGRVSGTGGITQITVTGTGSATYRALQVTISPSGQVRMCDPDPNLSSSDPRKC